MTSLVAGAVASEEINASACGLGEALTRDEANIRKK